jgi:hypothetical protein
MVIKIGENIDMEKSLWIHGEEIDQIFSILRIPIKPQVAVNIRPYGYEVHLDSDETKRWQFNLMVNSNGLMFKYDLTAIYDSAKGTSVGLLKQIMEASKWSFKGNLNSDINTLKVFFKHLANALKGRVF